VTGISSQILDGLTTFFTGGIFFLGLLLTWRAASFVTLVREKIEQLELDFVRFEKDNRAGHVKIELAIVKVGDRVTSLETNGPAPARKDKEEPVR
jgi:hypothetical protein